MSHEDYPLFRKVYDLSIWMTNRVEQYPKSQRFLLGSRTLDLCYELLSLVVESIYAKARRKELLLKMSLIVEKKRVLLRLAMDLKYLSFKQFEHVSKSLAEIGKMLGGWLKSSP